MKNVILVTVIGVAALMEATTANAAGGLMPPTTTVLAYSQMQGLVAKATDLIQERRNIVKEDKLYKDNQAHLQAEYRKKLGAASRERGKFESEKADIANAYKAACLSRGALPPSEKAQCDARRARDQTRIYQVQAAEQQYVKDFNTTVKGRYDDIFARQDKRRRQLAAKFNQTRDQLNIIHARYKVLLAYMRVHKADIVKDCQKLYKHRIPHMRPETLKWCSNKPFDGTSMKSPLMPEDGYGTGTLEF